MTVKSISSASDSPSIITFKKIEKIKRKKKKEMKIKSDR